MEKLMKQVIEAGKGVYCAGVKVGKVHTAVIEALAGDNPGKRPVAAWFAAFVAYFNAHSGMAWPADDKTGEPIGYRSLMRAALGKYAADMVYAAAYFNCLQSNLNSRKLVQVVKAQPKAKSGKANVVTADDVLKRLQGILQLAPEGKRPELAKLMARVAKAGFGIQNADFSANLKRH